MPKVYRWTAQVDMRRSIQNERRILDYYAGGVRGQLCMTWVIADDRWTVGFYSPEDELMDGQNFESWSQQTLAKFAKEVYAENKQLRDDLRVALDAYRKAIAEQKKEQQ